MTVSPNREETHRWYTDSKTFVPSDRFLFSHCMIEIIGISFLSAFFLYILFKKPVVRLLDRRGCPPYYAQCETNLAFKDDQSEIKMLILGDYGSGSDNQRVVAKAMEQTAREKGCDLVLLAGDNFIQKGISSVEDEQLQTKFESMYNLQVPFYAVLGNHDLAGNWRAQIDYTAISERWNMPATDYDFTAGPAQIYAINTTFSVKTLWRLYRKTDKPWRIGLGHHPAISSGRHGGMTWLERLIVAKSGIHFFISGHNHALEHTIYRGFDQIVSGGGGSPIRKSKSRPLPTTRFIFEDYGYIWAHITPNRVSFHYLDNSGKEVYTFSRQKAG